MDENPYKAPCPIDYSPTPLRIIVLRIVVFVVGVPGFFAFMAIADYLTKLGSPSGWYVGACWLVATAVLGMVLGRYYKQWRHK